MSPYIRITRFPCEEPYHLNIELSTSNGTTGGVLEFYVKGDDLISWADAFENFPLHAQSEYLWELGSERAEDRFACYVRLRLFTIDSLGHSALQIRLCNNLELPYREMVEMCICTDPAQFNELGKLFRAFSKLNHHVLYWSPTDGELFETIELAEQCIAADALRRG